MDGNSSLRNCSGSSGQEGDSPWVNLTWDDATWILTSSFIIFTMQTGFGMLESGCVSVKNEANIMMKNVVDVVFGGFTYWLFGFGLSFGWDKGSTPFLGIGTFLVDSQNLDLMGPVFSTFMFQLSFATTATTIVSGAMAERCNFRAYCLFSLLNTMVYCIPARWIWGKTGFLSTLGVIDIAGSGAVHLLGGISGFVAAWMLGPRLGRYDQGTASLPLGNPTNCIVGLFILWWGWLAFNSGSTFGVSCEKWKYAARASVTTMVASIGGGLVGTIYGFLKPGKYVEVMDLVNPVLGSLVGITAGCAVYHTYDAFVVGIIGGIVILCVSRIPDTLGVDDPVGAMVVHGFGGAWGMIAVGLFTEDDPGFGIAKGQFGLFRGGGLRLLQLQLLACACIATWSAVSTFTLLWVINKLIPIRMEEHEELLGADLMEHLVRRRHAGLTAAMSALGHREDVKNVKAEAVVIGGANIAHEQIVHTLADVRLKRWSIVKSKIWATSVFATSLKRSRNRRLLSLANNIPKPDVILTNDIPAVAKTVENSLGKIFRSEFANYSTDLHYETNYKTDYGNHTCNSNFDIIKEDAVFGKIRVRNRSFGWTQNLSPVLVNLMNGLRKSSNYSKYIPIPDSTESDDGSLGIRRRIFFSNEIPAPNNPNLETPTMHLPCHKPQTFQSHRSSLFTKLCNALREGFIFILPPCIGRLLSSRRKFVSQRKVKYRRPKSKRQLNLATQRNGSYHRQQSTKAEVVEPFDKGLAISEKTGLFKLKEFQAKYSKNGRTRKIFTPEGKVISYGIPCNSDSTLSNGIIQMRSKMIQVDTDSLLRYLPAEILEKIPVISLEPELPLTFPTLTSDISAWSEVQTEFLDEAVQPLCPYARSDTDESQSPDLGSYDDATDLNSACNDSKIEQAIGNEGQPFLLEAEQNFIEKIKYFSNLPPPSRQSSRWSSLMDNALDQCQATSNTVQDVMPFDVNANPIEYDIPKVNNVSLTDESKKKTRKKSNTSKSGSNSPQPPGLDSAELKNFKHIAEMCCSKQISKTRQKWLSRKWSPEVFPRILPPKNLENQDLHIKYGRFPKVLQMKQTKPIRRPMTALPVLSSKYRRSNYHPPVSSFSTTSLERAGAGQPSDGKGQRHYTPYLNLESNILPQIPDPRVHELQQHSGSDIQSLPRLTKRSLSSSTQGSTLTRRLGMAITSKDWNRVNHILFGNYVSSTTHKSRKTEKGQTTNII